MIVRRERVGDVGAVRAVQAAAFDRGDGTVAVEAPLVDALRAGEGWMPALSLVALYGDEVVGHVVCSRATVGGERRALGLGPIGVRPDRQGDGVGLALMHAVLAAADALDEHLVALLGAPAYYGRFGFVAASEVGIEAPDAAWGEFFQARLLSADDGSVRGRFAYAAAFDGV